MGYLKTAGFIMLSLPQSDVQPLQLLLKTSRGVVDRLNASIEDLFIPQVTALPDVKRAKSLPGFQGEEELDMSINANVDFLKGLSNFFNTKAAANFSYEKGRTFKIKLEAPQLKTVNIIHLSGFIKHAKMNTDAGNIIENLKNEEIYVITEIITAKGFLVEEAGNLQVGGEIALNAPNIANASTKTDVGQKKSSSLTYSGKESLTFAIKAYRIRSEGGGLFGGALKFTLESEKDIEKVREGTLYGEPLEASEYLNMSSDE
jgi:hypothetical protein